MDPERDIDVPARPRGSGEPSPAIRRAMEVSAAVACAAAVAWAFVLGQRVPLLWGVDLGFHELGHLVFAAAPGLVPPLAGTLVQLAVPTGLTVYFGVVRKEAYAAALLLAWTGTSARDASVYIADAPFERLPLLGGMHDWAWILGSTNRLSWAGPLSAIVWSAGLACVIAGIAIALAPAARELIAARRDAAYRARIATLPRREPRSAPVAGAATAQEPSDDSDGPGSVVR